MQPVKNSAASAASEASPWRPGRCGRKSVSIWCKSHERIPGCDIYRAGDGVHRRWLLQRARLLPEWRRKWLFSNRYHRYVMCAERAMYAAPELKAVICNAEMIKRKSSPTLACPPTKSR